MPTYYYRCDMIHCNRNFEVKHGMHEKLCDCPICKTKGSLTRMPPPFMIQKPDIHTSGKPGEVVQEVIQLSKEQLQQQKIYAASAYNVADSKKLK